MSLLDQSVIKADPTIIAAKLKKVPLQLFQSILTTWSQAVTSLWKSANPQAVFTQWGTSAADMVTFHTETAAFLLALPGITAAQTAQINAVVALAKPLTKNNDGTVTVNS